MGQHPDKFFVIWTPAMYTPTNTPASGYILGDQFSYWMTDTLAAGLDATYGAFPENVYVFDYFHDIDSLTYLPLSLAVSPTDNHPNAAATEQIAPLFVKDVFDAAIAYEESLLPVELSYFSASMAGSSVKLNWETVTEVNNYGFEILRKVHDDKEWTKIGFVNGNGNSNSPKSYSFVDDIITAGKFSYRLKQIDNDGQFEYSKTIGVDFGIINKFKLNQNYPNPFNSSTKISWQSPVGSWQTIKIFDMLGREIETLVNEYKETGNHSTLYIDNSTSPSGVYCYQLKAGDYVETRKMIFLK
jgi:hypothetical protein